MTKKIDDIDRCKEMIYESQILLKKKYDDFIDEVRKVHFIELSKKLTDDVYISVALSYFTQSMILFLEHSIKMSELAMMCTINSHKNTHDCYAAIREVMINSFTSLKNLLSIAEK